MKKYYGLMCASVLFVLCSVSPVFSAMEVNINNVVEAFLNNPIRAEQLYMNKEVQTEGRVEEIRRGDDGGFSVVLSGRGNFYFQCWLADESLNKAANLSRGSTINIRGTIYSFHQQQAGIFIAGNIVSLSDCVIVRVLTKAELEFRDDLSYARNGNANSQFNVGLAYANGDGVEQNFAEAARWYREAASRGHAGAMNNLGVLYTEGKGVEKNYTEAINWFRKAADNGDKNAMCNLGFRYENGEGVEKNVDEAVKWYERAAQEKQKNALDRLKALAEDGNTRAQLSLSYIYYYGKGTDKNYSEAFRLCEKAANAGDTTAISALGLMYYEGKAVTKDIAKAESLCKIAAEKGDSSAMLRLSDIYFTGKEAALAVRYLKQAMNAGNQEAGKLYEKHRKSLSELVERIPQLKAQAAGGDKTAKSQLSRIYENIDKNFGREQFNAMLSEFGLNNNPQNNSSFSHSGQYTIIGSKVNIRSAPNTHAGIITQLNTGDPVSLIDTSRKGGNTWHKIMTSDGTIGWVFGDYVTRN